MNDTILDFITRHFLVLGCDYESFNRDGSPLAKGLALYSGFFMEINDTGFWVTAGHCLKEINDAIREGTLRITGGGFMDSFAANAIHHHVYPYTYSPSDSLCLDLPEHGIDFGVIQLDYLQCVAFFGNGVVPIFEGNWRGTEGLTFDAYKVLGVPAETIVPKPNSQDTGISRSVIRIHPLPADHPARSSKHPDWFVGKLDEACPLDSIKGMSGGPIFGMSIKGNEFSYRAIALQSWWDPKTRIVYGCPLPFFASELHKFLAAMP